MSTVLFILWERLDGVPTFAPANVAVLWPTLLPPDPLSLKSPVDAPSPRTLAFGRRRFRLLGAGGRQNETRVHLDPHHDCHNAAIGHCHATGSNGGDGRGITGCAPGAGHYLQLYPTSNHYHAPMLACVSQALLPCPGLGAPLSRPYRAFRFVIKHYCSNMLVQQVSVLHTSAVGSRRLVVPRLSMRMYGGHELMRLWHCHVTCAKQTRSFGRTKIMQPRKI